MPWNVSHRTAAAVVFASILLVWRPAAQAQDAADILQIEAVPGGTVNVIQQGWANRATIDQRYLSEGALDAQNRAAQMQRGDNNAATILQEGSGNSAEIAQNGSHNEGAILQHNSGNTAELQQNGNGLSIKIEQYGAAMPGSAPVTVTQSN